MAQVSFDTYKIWYSSGSGDPSSQQVLIPCFQGNVLAGNIAFYRDEAPASEVRHGKLLVCFRIDQFQDIHQILLHEKPLFLFVNETKGIGTLGTLGFEPTGEEE
jgi:hypothetical protein